MIRVIAIYQVQTIALQSSSISSLRTTHKYNKVSHITRHDDTIRCTRILYSLILVRVHDDTRNTKYTVLDQLDQCTVPHSIHSIPRRDLLQIISLVQSSLVYRILILCIPYVHFNFIILHFNYFTYPYGYRVPDITYFNLFLSYFIIVDYTIESIDYRYIIIIISLVLLIR